VCATRVIRNFVTFLLVVTCTGSIAQTEIQLHDDFTLAYSCKPSVAGGLAYRDKKCRSAEMKTGVSLNFTLIVRSPKSLRESQPYCAALRDKDLSGEKKLREKPICAGIRVAGSDEEVEKICYIQKVINLRPECDEYVFYGDGGYFRFGHRDPKAIGQASIIQGQCKYSKEATVATKAKELNSE
jgi:hypothetical protein